MTFRPALIVGAILLSACSVRTTSGYSGAAIEPATSPRAAAEPQTAPSLLAAITYVAVDRLLATATEPVPSGTVFLVASIANLNDLSTTGSLGRLISEEAATRLIQLKYRVPEIRLAETMHVREGGEFILSRDIASLRRTQNAALVVTGTYSLVGTATRVNLRLVRLADGIPVAATEFDLPLALALPNERFAGQGID